MPRNHPNDGGIGKEIDWSLVIPSITRPTWEAPALEVLDKFEVDSDKENIFFNFNHETWKTRVPNTEVRLQIVDSMSEGIPLNVYYDWTLETLAAAVEVGDWDKIGFYEGLRNAVIVDYRDVYNELATVNNENVLGTPLSSMHSSEFHIDDENNDSEVDTLNLQPQSANPPETDSRSDHNNTIDNDAASDQEISNATNVDAPPIVDPAPPKTARTERPTRGIFAAMVRNLCCYTPSPDEE